MAATRRKTITPIELEPPTPAQEYISPCAELRELQQVVATACADLDNFKNWQCVQNGSLQRIEQKVDKILWRVIVAGGAICLCLIGVIVEQAVAR